MKDMLIGIGKSDDEHVSVSAHELVTGRTCVIAQSGAGKSWTISVICEQLLKHNLPFCIIDTEGEYYSLKQAFNILWIGGKKSDIELNKVDMKKLAEKIVTDSIPVILDVSDVIEEKEVVAEFTKYLYEAEDHMRKPYLLIVEEADKFIPQSKEAMKQIEEIARRGRKRGLGLIIATQRPALVNKNTLSQCSNQLIGKLTTENDLQAVNLFFGSRKQLEEIPELGPGEFFVMGNISKKKKVKIRNKVTKHTSATPKLVKKKYKKISYKDILKKEEVFDIPEEEAKPIKVRVLKPAIKHGEAVNIAASKRKKKFILFGKKEDIKYTELELLPMINIQISHKEGLIKKQLKKYSIVVDATTGKFITLDSGLSEHPGFEELIGLKTNEIKVLLEISRGKKNLTVLKKKTRISDKNIKSALNKLEKENFITKEKKGREKIYSPLFKIRKPDFSTFQEVRAKEITIPGKPAEAVLTKKEAASIVSAFLPESKIIKYEQFYYPMYAVHFQRRIVNVDAISGRII